MLDKLMAEKGNDRCIDCGSKLSVDWASVNLGVFFCIDCSGRHRSFGVHISFVRSITMDKALDLLSLPNPFPPPV